MSKIISILFLDAFARTLPEGDLTSRQRFRLFRITTLFAVFVFAGVLYQISLTETSHTLSATIIYGLFIAVFVNYFTLSIHKKSRLAFMTLLLLSFSLLHISSYGQGGVRNSGLFYLSSLILIAFMLLGKRPGKIMAGLSIIHVVFFYIAAIYTDWTDYSLIGPDPHLIDLDFLITGVLGTLLLTALAHYIEKNKTEIVNDIICKRNELVATNSRLLESKDLLKEVNTEYAKKNTELKQKNRELEQFTYVASHDLQEPLRTTSSFVNLLKQHYKGKLDERADKYIDYVTEASERMQVLITDLIDYISIGSQPAHDSIDCNLILQRVVEEMNFTIQQNDAVIECGPLPVIHGNKDEIRQLFQSLLGNAIKFRRTTVSPNIKISAIQQGKYWKFMFRDNGIGIAPEHTERIFTIFQRLHPRHQYQGSGIGLSYCKKIVELYDGRIWLQSEPGEGSSFYFTLSDRQVNLQIQSK